MPSPTSTDRLFALVDCNNFYASCERVFRPDLEGRPVVVLSNNDGCIIARSAEAKALGYKMGDLYHDSRQRLQRDGVMTFSSNYALYGDMSDRVTAALRSFTPLVEVYSIDESFLQLIGERDPVALGRTIKETVRRETGIPVCVGLAPTKTLAKLANRIAKKNPEHAGVFLFPGHGDEILQATPVEDIWGVAGRITRRLADLGITTAYDLASADHRMIRSRFNVVLERTALELRGISCLELEMVQPAKKGIMVSRGFGRRVKTLRELQEAVAAYATRAAEKMRRQNLAVNKVTVIIRTSPFDESQPRYSNAFSVSFPEAVFDTAWILKATAFALKKIYRPGLSYQKAGVFLDGLEPADRQQGDFFFKPDRSKAQALMAALDKINRECGRDTLRYAAAGIDRSWKMRQQLRSPRYTTRLEDIPRVR